MLDLTSRWPPSSGVGSAEFSFGPIAVQARCPVHQVLVSGDVAAAMAALGIVDRPVGAFEVAQGEPYAAAVASDTVLAVLERPLPVREGWNDPGFALTVVSDAYAVLDITGKTLETLKRRAANPSLVTGSPSASITFASRQCIAYHYRSAAVLRVHVNRAYQDYLVGWMRAACVDAK
jgi:hypothetical protein